MIKTIARLMDIVSFGLLNLCRKRSVELFKVSVLKVYVQGIKTLRKHSLILFVVIFCTMVFAETVVILPIAIILLMSWSAGTKAMMIGGLGVVYLTLSIVFVVTLFSEKRWLQLSGSEGLMKKVIKEK